MRARASVVRGLCIVLVLGLSMSACTVVGFFSGVAATNKREARLNARATSEERAACRARRKEQIEHAHEAGEDADEIPGCTDREIRIERKAQPGPSIAGRVIAGLVIDLVVIAVLYAYALGSVPSH